MDQTLEQSDLATQAFKSNLTTLNLKDVICAPDLEDNFLSVSRLIKAGLVVKFFEHDGLGKANIFCGKNLIVEEA